MGLLMRNNTPVTQNEYLLNEGSTLMSTTNTHSHITYANSAFIDASGYKEESLLGEPHNLIRHPDMPAEAFGDMWFTLQQGETWTGLVKNRRQNGDDRDDDHQLDDGKPFPVLLFHNSLLFVQKRDLWFALRC